MKCIVPINTGFCFGVDLAVRAAYENAGKSAYMYGEVVHNPVVVNDLIDKGWTLISDLSEIPSQESAKVLIRAHGVSKSVIDSIHDRGLSIVDKTCPKVKMIHDIVSDASSRGLDVIIVGKPNHPEIEGIIGWCSTKPTLLDSLDDAKRVIGNTTFSNKGVCMVSQTTHNKKKYEEIYAYCKERIKNIEYHDTICDDTANRQKEIRELAQQSDAVIVVGGKKSSNVTKLYEIASEYCKAVYHVEDEKQLDCNAIKNAKVIVIASGASTPNETVKAVLNKIKASAK